MSATITYQRHRAESKSQCGALMNLQDNQPVVTQQTIAQNEAVENVLTRFEVNEIVIPQYQRDADQWDDSKKSLFIESVLNRLTVPAFYFALSQENSDVTEVVDGQQRLTTLVAFFNNDFALSSNDDCPYYGASAHYAGKTYRELGGMALSQLIFPTARADIGLGRRGSLFYDRSGPGWSCGK